MIGELPKLTGTDVTGSNPVQELRSWLGTLGSASRPTVVRCLAALVVVFGRGRRTTNPGRSRIGCGGSACVRALRFRGPWRGLGWRGAPRAAEIEVPDIQILVHHPSTVALAAVALVLIGFSQTAGDARSFAAKHRYRIDINQESVAQGMANVGAGVFQGMPVSRVCQPVHLTTTQVLAQASLR